MAESVRMIEDAKEEPVCCCPFRHYRGDSFLEGGLGGFSFVFFVAATCATLVQGGEESQQQLYEDSAIVVWDGLICIQAQRATYMGGGGG